MTKILSIGFVSLLFTANAWSYESTFKESEVFEKNGNTIKSAILDHFIANQECKNDLKNNFWTLEVVKTPRGVLPDSYKTPGQYRMRYSRYGCELGKFGALVIAPGRGEASIDYYETAIDFINLGYSPVYVADHRGQGFSPRLLPSTKENPLDHHKGHLGRYEDYVIDMKHMVVAVENDLKNNFGRTTEPLFYTSNSMGGAIGVGYFQMMGKDNPFKAASLHGSQVIVNYVSFLDDAFIKNDEINYTAFLRKFILFGMSKQGNLVNKITQVRCSAILNQCEDYGAKPGEYTDKPFKENTEAIMTHSRPRFELAKHFRTFDREFWNQIIPTPYSENETFEGVYVGGATNQWTRETSRFNSEMVEIKNLAKMTNIPLRLVTGERDLRAYREYTKLETHLRKKHGLPAVDLYHHDKMCDDLNVAANINNALNGKPFSQICDHVKLEEGFHELYKESDQWRNPAIKAAHEHFQKALKQ